MNLGQLSGFTIEQIIPNTLTDHQINEVRISMQEAWSSEYSLGELAKCTNCGKIYSKESLFAGFSEINTKKDSVLEIFENTGLNEASFFCHNKGCNGSLYFPYGKNYNEYLRKYFASRATAILVLIRDNNRNGRIVGFEGGYSGDFDTIFHEFKDHYSGFSGVDFEKAITNLLGAMPPEFFVCAYVGIDQYYRRNIRVSMNILMNLLDVFSKSVPDDIVGITETDRRNVLHRLMIANGAYSLNLDSNSYGKTLLQSASQDFYQSDVLVHPSPNQGYRDIIQCISKTVNRTSATIQ